MGSVNAKDTNETTISNIPAPLVMDKSKSRKNQLMSPLHRTISASLEDKDPRSPGSRRTPIHTPFSTPPLHGKAYRDRILLRLGSASKFNCADPRSPACRRTPISQVAMGMRPTPPPFSLGVSFGDPRSPYMMRTPLALSSQEVLVDDDVVIAEEVAMRASGEALEKTEKAESVDVENSVATESVAQREMKESFTSSGEYSISPIIMALTISPLNSPALGYRKRKQDMVKDRYAALSPLKKSYSAPSDENIPPSPLKHSSNTVNNTNNTKARTPLSPLSQRVINTRYCMDIQPIKFRMDPGILG